MKKFLFLVLMLSLTGFHINAQTNDRPNAVGIWGGLTQYNGDLGQGIYNFSKAKYGHFGINYSRYITNRFDFTTAVLYGGFGYYENVGKNFHANQLQWNAEVRLNLVNADTKKLIPYLFGGIGVSDLSGKYVKPGTDMCVPFGFGFRYRVNERINLHIQETFAYTDHDDRDGEIRNSNDGYAMHSIGITYNFGSIKDADKDGVIDKLDKCPGTPLGVKVDANGCPLDRDGDGIADYQDSCPDVKGVAALHGCPDKDGDGITDALDKCPDVAGPVALQGCPDTDGDGIIDIEDACPTVKGTLANKGCPEKDTDGDGIIDTEDSCPDQVGVIENKGCPAVKEEVKEQTHELVAAVPNDIQNILFATSKADITKENVSILNNVVKVMKENPSYKLAISGHTDNTGAEKINLSLSEKRAANVKNYIVNKGISAKRLTAKGFSSTVPVGDNTTPEGRAKNRRVEFKISK